MRNSGGDELAAGACGGRVSAGTGGASDVDPWGGGAWAARLSATPWRMSKASPMATPTTAKVTAKAIMG